MLPIDRFAGPYRFLSNFWPSAVTLDGEEYSTVEHAFQAAKTTDMDARVLVRMAFSPGVAKQRGRMLALRPDWEAVKVEIMAGLLRQKFTNHAELREALLNTGDALLVEGNTWGDTFWGVDAGKGGANHLGRLLMQIRTEVLP